MLRLKSDLLPALIATADGVLKTFDLRWHDDAALTVVMASNGYPGDYAKGSEIRGLERAGGIEGVEIFHAGTAREGDRGWSPPAAACSTSAARGKSVSRGAAARLSGGGQDRLARRILPLRHRLAGDAARRARKHERSARSVPRLRRAAHQDCRRCRDLRCARRARARRCCCCTAIRRRTSSGTGLRPSLRGTARW